MWARPGVWWRFEVFQYPISKYISDFRQVHAALLAGPLGICNGARPVIVITQYTMRVIEPIKRMDKMAECFSIGIFMVHIYSVMLLHYLVKHME